MVKHRLSELLKERGAKVKLADDLDTSAGVISDLCSGKATLNERWIERISEALNIPPWHIFADPEKIYPKEHRRIVDAYMNLSAAEQSVLDKILFKDKAHAQDEYVIPENFAAQSQSLHERINETIQKDFTPQEIEELRKRLREGKI